MIYFPCAKVNLGLNVLSKREDGFHNLQSVLLPIGLSDILEVISNGSDNIEFSMTGTDENLAPEFNLVVKAWHLLHDSNRVGGVKAQLHKIIPSGAGLGGGSSDGATMLLVLNEMFALGLTFQELLDLAAELGSDCPFFIAKKPALISGRGECVQAIEIPALAGKHITVVNPGIHISTTEAFAEIKPTIPEWPITQVLAQPIEDWQDRITNDFEITAFGSHPIIKEIKETLLMKGALYAAMSGTGSTVFGIFENEVGIKEIYPDYFTWEGVI